MQVVMQVAPDWLLEQLYSSFLRGSLAALATHPLSNFGVQAYLSALQTSQQVPITPFHNALSLSGPGLLQTEGHSKSSWLKQFSEHCI